MATEKQLNAKQKKFCLEFRKMEGVLQRLQLPLDTVKSPLLAWVHNSLKILKSQSTLNSCVWMLSGRPSWASLSGRKH